MTVGNGIQQAFEYNDRLQMKKIAWTKNNSVIQRYDYSFGQIDPQSGSVDTTKNNGQLAQVESYIGGTASSPTKQFTQKFSYDSIGRLEKENEYRGDNGSQVYQQKFSFDRFGNRYLKSSENPSNQNPLAPTPLEDNNIERATNRFAANTGTVYDDAGNVVSDDKFREMDFVYDANGRMAKATKANFPEALSVFDAGGNKVATRVNDVWRFQIYDAGGKCVAEYGGPQSADDGGVKYTHQDIQGSTRTISTQAGFAQARMDYQAFGEQISSSIGQRTATGYAATDTLRNRYALTERDEATGLDDTWFRKLENRGGRWTSPDPYNGSASIGNGQSWNRYSYVENQPTNYVDPSGLLLAITQCEREVIIIWSEDGTTIEQIFVSYTNCRTDFIGIGGGVTFPGPINGPDGGGGGVVRPWISQFPPIEGIPRRPPQPRSPRDPCGGSTDLNASVGNITFGVRIGERAVVPYAGFFVGLSPLLSGTMSHSDSRPSMNFELSTQASIAPGLGVTRTSSVTPNNGFVEDFGQAVREQLPYGGAANSLAAMSPQIGASLTAPLGRINLSNDSILCR